MSRTGERWLNNGIGGKMRCRAITTQGTQCRHRANGFVTTVAVCGQHRRGIKAGKPFCYVVLP